MRGRLIVWLVLLACGNPGPPEPPETVVVQAQDATLTLVPGAACAAGTPPPGRFTEYREAWGVDFVYSDHFTDSGQEFWKDLGGVAVADLDGDRALDLYLANYGDADAVYVTGGRGAASFQRMDRVASTGVPRSGVVSLADLDGDGALDALLGGNELSTGWARGLGTGAFADPVPLPQGAGFDALPVAHGFATGDVDGDGWLDVCTAVHDEFRDGENWPGREWFSRNAGGVLEADDDRIPPTRVEDMTFVCSLLDLDDDGDLDVLETNDAWSLAGLGLDRTDTEVQGNRVFRNDGGLFTDASAGSGANIEISSMGLAAGDYDNDGDLDLYVTSMPPLPSALLRNDGALRFSDVTYDAEADTLFPEHDVGWGAVFVDADADGWQDLFVVHGYHTSGDGEGLGPAIVNANHQADVLLRNLGDGRFESLEAAASGVDGKGWGRSVAVGDLNRDGFPDVVVTNADGRPDVWRNGCDARPWLTVSLEGPAPNTHGVGARVRVRSADRIQTRWILGGGDGLYGMSAPEAYFGFPDGTEQVDLQVRWPDGGVTQATVPARRHVVLTRRPPA